MTSHVPLVAPRIADLPTSPTIAVAKQAAALRERGVDVVDFGPGEPDFDTPPNIRDAAIRALNEGQTRYAPSRGLPGLREAVAHALLRWDDLHYDPDDIIITPGAKQSIVEAVLATVSRGDEAVLLDPGWGSYDAIVRLAGATPVHVQLDHRSFTIDPDRLRAAISPRTRAIITGTPNNPTGHVLAREEIDLLAELCEENNLVLISDEIYDRIVYGGIQPISPATHPALRDRTITINGFSKAYAMTGWRLGYAAGPRAIIDAMLKVHEHSVTAATTFVQVAGIEALNGPQEPIDAMVAEFASRRELVVQGLAALPGVRVRKPDGTFYVFPDISGTGMDGTELAARLLDAAVAVTPGAGFGTGWDTNIRLSFATSPERIREGLRRMATVLAG